MEIGPSALELSRENAALKVELERYRSMVETASDVISLIDTEARFTYVSPSMTVVAGYQPQELVGRSALELIHPDDLPRVREALARAASQGETVVEAYRWRTADGRWLWAESNGVNRLADPAVRAIVVSTRDISKRHEAEELARQVIHGAHCILWSSLVEERDGQKKWNLQIADPEAAQRVIPLQMPPDRSHGSVMHYARLPEDRERVNENAHRAFDQGLPGYEQEFRCRRSDGSICWLHENVRIELLGPGRWWVVGVCTDVTAIKLVEQRLQHIVSTANCLLWYARVRQVDGQIAWDLEIPDHRAAQRFLPVETRDGESYENAWLRSKNAEDVARMDANSDQSLLNGRNSYTQEYRCRRSDGEWRWLREDVNIIPQGAGQWQAVGVCIDVTEEKAAAQRLNEAHAVLEARVEERTAALETANRALRAENAERQMAVGALHEAMQALQNAKEDAEQASRAKSDFLSRMSHELRTPLNAILGFAQVMQIDTSGLSQRQQQGLEHILKGGRHLLALINEVLDLARVEAGRMDLSPEPVQVQEVVQEVLDLVRPLGAGRNIRFIQQATPEWSCFVLADRQRLRQVLLNLLSNAIKYNREGGSVELAVVRNPSGGLQIRVIDSGPGLAPESISRLFVPFERLNLQDHNVEGTGLGLALSRGLAELMHGHLGVESTLGQGCTFWLELPLAKAPHQSMEAQLEELRPTPASDGVAIQTVLCIEDNPANFQLIEAVLESRPHLRLLQAIQGSIGLELATLHRPDVILLDLHLPDFSGEEVLRRLRAQPVTENTPVIVVSADATSPRIQRLLANGVHAYLTKPLNIQQFLDVLDSALQSEVPHAGGS